MVDASPPTEGIPFRDRLHDALRKALRHATVPGWVMGDDEDPTPYPFVDLMSDPKTTIATGEARIEDFADAVAEEMLELLDGAQPAEPRAEQPIAYGVIVASRQMKSAAVGNPIMTADGERFWAMVEPEGWVEATSTRANGISVPADVKTFATAAQAEEFAKRWEGHPWWCSPNGQYEIVPLVPILETQTRTLGYARQPPTKAEHHE